MFREFLNDLEATGREKTAKTYRSLLSSFDSWLQENEIAPEEFTRSDVRRFLDSIGWANSSKNTFLQALKSWADYYEDEIPVGKTLEEMQEARQQEKRLRSLQKMRTYDTENKEPNSVDPSEIQLLLETSKPRDGCIFYLYFYFGWRLKEFLNIEKIEWEKNVLTVRTLKRNTTRRLPFSREGEKILRHVIDEGWNELHSNTIGKIFRRKTEAVDVDQFTPHVARRTFRTEMKKQGVGKVVVKKLLGHKLKDVTDSDYLNVDFDELGKAMREDHYFSQVQVPVRRLLR